MSKIILTDGTEITYFTNCDCGLTGGCNKCYSFVYTPEMQQEDIELAELDMKEYYEGLESVDKNEFIIPEAKEEKFMDEDLRKFYKKKGYKLKG